MLFCCFSVATAAKIGGLIFTKVSYTVLCSGDKLVVCAKKPLVNDYGGDILGGRGQQGSNNPADRVVSEIRASGGEAVPNYGETLHATEHLICHSNKIQFVIN